MSKKFQLKPKDHIKLAKYCKKVGKRYACTAFDTESLKFLLKNIDLPFIKIPSGEINNFQLFNGSKDFLKKGYIEEFYMIR